MINDKKAHGFVVGTFEMLAKTGCSLNYQSTAKQAEALFTRNFDAFTEDDRYVMGAIVAALLLSTDVDTGLIEPMTKAELKIASEAISKGGKHGKQTKFI
jgi:hypothetical protein